MLHAGRGQRPDLKRAWPGDSDAAAPGFRRVVELREMLFGDGCWWPVTVVARWLDRSGRDVVQVSWRIGGEGWYGQAFVAEAAKERDAADPEV